MKAYRLESGLSYLPAYGNFSGLGISLSVKAGSFGQTKKESAHALEHLLFCNKIDNKKAVETLAFLSNGNYNGLTDLDSISFYALVPAPEAKTATEVFSKMIQNSSFDENDINHEKTALKLELLGFDTPSSRQSLILCDKMYNNRQLNEALRPATDSEINSLNKADLLEFYDEFFTPNNLSIAFFSNLSKDYIGFLVNNYYGEFGNTHKSKNIEIPKAVYNTDTAIIYSNAFKKSRLGFGLPLVPRTLENGACRSYIYTISYVLSQNLQNLLRYDKGLVYSTKHYLEFNKTLGYFVLEIDSLEEDAPAVEKIVKNELDRIKSGEFSKEDISKINFSNIYNKNITRRFSPLDQALNISRFYEDYIESDHTNTDESDKIDLDYLRKVSNEYFGSDKLSEVVIHPEK